MKAGRSRIFFDFDGPILDVSRRHHRVYADTVSELGGIPVSLEDFWVAKRNKTPDTDILQRSGLSDADNAVFQTRKLERIEADDYLALDLVVKEVMPLLQRLSQSHRLTLVTLRNSRAALERQLNRLGLACFFEAVLSGREGGRPGWQIKTGLIRERHSSLDTADWIVGDTETDILAGKALGIRTAAVCNGIRRSEFLSNLKPDLLLESAKDFIPNAAPSGVASN